MRSSDENTVLKELAKEQRQAYIRKYCPEFKPEHGNYTVSTTTPKYVYHWKLNMLRRTREEDLKDEAMQAARLKCYESANAFTLCSYNNPMNETKMCMDQFKLMKTCFVQECEIEMDKRRRDVTRNHEWWWTNIYDENGPIGEQAKFTEDTYVEKVLDACFWIRNKYHKLLGWDEE